MTRVAIRPEMLRWACDRARVDTRDLAVRIPQLPAWENGEKQPTLKQLEGFAKATHTPIGYLLLKEPIDEPVPIPDFRTVADARMRRPSPDLLDTVYLCQQRQDWYRDYARSEGEDKLSFVGSAKLSDDVLKTAAVVRNALGFDLAARGAMPTWTEALRGFIAEADATGILVMVSGVVGSNNKRKLDPEEFRGFALADDLAPLVFINGSDTKAAQMFTLAHELAHIWLGESALSNAQASEAPRQAVERWCNQFAAELLVPLDVFREDYNRRAALRGELDRLAKRFKVSTLVILRRMHDAGGLRGDAYWDAYKREVRHLREITKSGGGGNFYLTMGTRLSRRFARALVASTLEGRTLYRDAFRMLGIRKDATFRQLGASLGYPT